MNVRVHILVFKESGKYYTDHEAVVEADRILPMDAMEKAQGIAENDIVNHPKDFYFVIECVCDEWEYTRLFKPGELGEPYEQ